MVASPVVSSIRSKQTGHVGSSADAGMGATVDLEVSDVVGCGLSSDELVALLCRDVLGMLGTKGSLCM